MADVNQEGGQGAAGGWTRVVTGRPRLTLLLALLFVALTVVAGSGVGDRLSSGGFEAPHSQSAYATDALARDFPASQPNLVLLVDTRSADPDSPAVAAEGRRLARRLAADPDVVGVTSYWDGRAPVLRARDGSSAMITARLRGDDDAVAREVKRIAPAFRGVHGPIRVSVGGNAQMRHEMQSTIQQDLVRAEAIALPVTLVLLVMVFGSAVAAMLPLAIGLIAILGTSAVLRAVTEFTDVSVFAENLTTALGLGLAVDYALFIVRRFREELASGAAPLPAVAATLRTAGRTVLFSALTVAAALSAMLVFPQYFLRSFAYAGVAVVLLAAGAALVVLPAVLVLLGERVNALDLRRLRRRRRAGAQVARVEPGSRYAALARLVMRRAPVFAVGAVGVLLLLGLPFLSVQFGSADDRQLPSGAESHVVQQHLRTDYAGSTVGAITVLAQDAGPAALADYRRQVAALPGVVRVEGPFTGGGDTGTAYLEVVPEGPAVDAGSQRLVGRIRAVPADFRASVAGQSAVLVDSKHAIAGPLPWAAGIVGARHPGAGVPAHRQCGGARPGGGAQRPQPDRDVRRGGMGLPGRPPVGAAGLHHDRQHRDDPAGPDVLRGLRTVHGLRGLPAVPHQGGVRQDGRPRGVHRVRPARTGGLITAAAVILAVVMVGIGMSRVTNTKMLGMGIALAVLMDAMVIRTLLVPAVMRLTGRATWWAPGALRRFHERFGISEGGAAAAPSEEGGAPRSGERRDPEPAGRS